jgi:O-antigen/teichoic acid export membrane protein
MTELEQPPLQPGDEISAAGPTVGTRAFRGGLWQSAAQVAPYLWTMIMSVVAARILGPDQMGRQSFIAFAVVVVQTLCVGGLGNALLRYVAELRGRGRERALPSLAAWGWRLSAVAGSFGALVLFAITAAGASPTWAWIFAGVAALSGALNKVPGTILIGTQRWRLHARVVIVTGSGSVLATVIVLLLGGGVSGMLGVIAATAVAMLIWMTALARRLLRPMSLEPEPLGSLRAELLRFSLAMSVPVILNLVVFQRSELFFLERFSSDAQIALYSIAFSTTAALIAVPAAIGSVLTPSVATLVGSGEFERIRRGYSRVLRLGLLFSLPLTGAGLALGPGLLHLVYGHRYAGAGDILLIILATLPLTPLVGASSALLIGYGRLRAPIVVSSIAAAADIGLAALLVPRLDAIGAGIANTGAFSVAAVLLIGYAVRLVGGVQLGWRSVVRVAAVSVAASGLARLLLVAGDSAGVFVAAAAVEVAVLAVLAVALRVVPEEDAAFLVRVASSGSWLARVIKRLSGRALGAIH